jgi:polyhydroxyalkanoate synthesis regulator phasin
MSKFLNLLNPFFTDEGGDKPIEKQQANATVTPTTGNQSSPIVNPVTTSVNFATKPAYNEFIKDFVARFQKLIEDNDQQGFDFKEFTESIFENSPNPGADIYRIVFNTAKKMDKTVNVAKLLESAGFYKSLVENAAVSTLKEADTKKQSLLNEKTNESNQLTTDLDTIGKNITRLEQQLQDLRDSQTTKTNELSLIDGKYESQFGDIEVKVGALNEAKLLVINSIVDVEAGIQNNIK